MFEQKSILGKKPFLFKVDEFEGIDINTHMEFMFAEYLFTNSN